MIDSVSFFVTVHANGMADGMALLRQVGPEICVFKTHVDAFDTWDEGDCQQATTAGRKAL